MSRARQQGYRPAPAADSLRPPTDTVTLPSMPDPTPSIAELSSHAGQVVTVRGWVTHVRSSGKIAFAVVRDGTGIVQTVFVKSQLPAETWNRFSELTLET